MIRTLGEQDHAVLMDLLSRESALNTFLIGDLENNGVSQDFQEFWGDFDSGSGQGGLGKLRAVLLRYYGSFIPYAPGDFDVDGFAALLRENRQRMATLSGIDRVINRFGGLPGLLPDSFLCRALSFVQLESPDRIRDLPVRTAAGGEGSPLAGAEKGTKQPSLAMARATPEDVPALMDLWRGIEEFGFKEGSEQSNRRELEQGAARAYFIREVGPGGRVVSTVKTTAENSRSAMIVAVATHPDYRQRGLATALLAHVCRELFGEGKRPCLFYDNPAAGTIYRRLGFTDIGTWVMYLRS